MTLQTIKINLAADQPCMNDPKCSSRVYFWKRWYFENHPAAVLNLLNIENTDDWLQICTASVRNRYRHSVKLGYTSSAMSMADRNERLNDLYEINTSSMERQGKPMTEFYKTYPGPQTDSKNVCPWHYDQLFGVFSPFGQWVGYINLHLNGDVASISMLLGHKQFLSATGIMLNLMAPVITFCKERSIRYITYHLYDSGTPGLIYWKKSIGMQPMNVKTM